MAAFLQPGLYFVGDGRGRGTQHTRGCGGGDTHHVHGAEFCRCGQLDLDRVGRHAMDVMTTDIRQATSLTAYATNQLVFRDLTNGTFSYTWTPSNTTLIRVYNGQSQLLLTNCDSLAFHTWQHTPSNNFNFWPATTTTNAKLIDVSWTCSRSILGKKVNTESVQTAKIALRN